MRTTVEFAEDCSAAIQKLRREQGIGTSEAVNALIRAGLANRAPQAPFHQRTRRLGLTIDVSNVAEALEQLEGPGRR